MTEGNTKLTDAEFEIVFATFSDGDMFRFLAEHLTEVRTDRNNLYGTRGEGDLKAVVQQELYERLTGRQ